MEVTVSSYKIPWLIWIQLILLFLLFALLFCFAAVVPLDSDHDVAATAVAASFLPTASTPFQLFGEIQQIHHDSHDSTTTTTTTTLRHLTQGAQNEDLVMKGEVLSDSSSSMSRDEIIGEEASSLNPHPCHYFQLATVAFLKCFGLDSTSDSSNPKRRKRKES